MQIFYWLHLKLPKKVIKIIKQWIRSLVSLFIGTVLYYVLKTWGYPGQDFIDEIFLAFVFSMITVTITENQPRFFSFSLWNKSRYFKRYGNTVVSNATQNVVRLDLPIENQDVPNALFKILLPCFSGVDAQYIPVLCKNSNETSISKVSFKFEHLTLFSSRAKKISQQYPIKCKPVIPYINPLAAGEKILLIFEINLNHYVSTELKNGRILLGISTKANRAFFRQYYLLELQVFAGRCELLTQNMHSLFLVFYFNQWIKGRQIETAMKKNFKSS